MKKTKTNKAETLRKMADNAIYSLVFEILVHGDIPANWTLIDKIEKRFKMVGAAQFYIDQYKAKKEKFKKNYESNNH